jgi:predicted outer membrane protein
LSLTALAACDNDDDDDDDGGNYGGAGGAFPAGGATGSGGSTAGTGGTGGSGGSSTTLGGAGGAIAGAAGEGGEAGGAAGGAGGEGGLSAEPVQPNAAATLTDSQLLYVADVLNLGEVEESRVALPRLVRWDVRGFAEEMIVDHADVRRAGLELAQSLELDFDRSAVSDRLRKRSDRKLRLLLDSNAANLDDLYMDIQVEAHQEALALVGVMITAADNTELRSYLTQVRAGIEEHQQRAIEVVNRNDGEGGQGGSDG